MDYQALEPASIAGGEPQSPRGVLGNSGLKTLTQRSNPRGARRLSFHAGCMSATALLMWFVSAYWHLLIPAMALNGITIVTLFAPMHDPNADVEHAILPQAPLVSRSAIPSPAALHLQIRDKLSHLAPSYRAANLAVIQSLS